MLLLIIFLLFLKQLFARSQKAFSVNILISFEWQWQKLLTEAWQIHCTVYLIRGGNRGKLAKLLLMIFANCSTCSFSFEYKEGTEEWT
jgi:hypothetical protein